MEVRPLEALLDVRVLVDDPGLERREVRRGAGRELVDEGALEVRRRRRSVAIARETDVKYSLNEPSRSPARPRSLT